MREIERPDAATVGPSEKKGLVPGSLPIKIAPPKQALAGRGPPARREAIAAAIALLAKLYPKCFSVYERKRKPLRVGIHANLLAALDGALTPAGLHAALRFYVGNPAYLRAMLCGAWRIDLDGQVAGVVTLDEEAHAKAALGRIKAKRAARVAAAKNQAPPVKRLSLADLKAAARARKNVPPVGINTERYGRK